VPGPDLDDLRRAPDLAAVARIAKLVPGFDARRIGGQRAQQRRAVVLPAPLDEHRALVRENAGDLVVVPQDFAARLVAREQALSDFAVRGAVDDVHGLDAVPGHVDERALVAQRFHGPLHAGEPLARVIGERERRQYAEQPREPQGWPGTGGAHRAFPFSSGSRGAASARSSSAATGAASGWMTMMRVNAPRPLIAGAYSEWFT